MEYILESSIILYIVYKVATKKKIRLESGCFAQNLHLTFLYMSGDDYNYRLFSEEDPNYLLEQPRGSYKHVQNLDTFLLKVKIPFHKIDTELN